MIQKEKRLGQYITGPLSLRLGMKYNTKKIFHCDEHGNFEKTIPINTYWYNAYVRYPDIHTTNL